LNNGQKIVCAMLKFVHHRANSNERGNDFDDFVPRWRRANRRCDSDYQWRNRDDAACVFATERGGPFTPDAINRLVKRIGARALRLSGARSYASPRLRLRVANAGHDTRAIQDWLGHRSIQHSVRYTELAPTRFSKFWRD
jgi:site-specific recombinase XerD